MQSLRKDRARNIDHSGRKEASDEARAEEDAEDAGCVVLEEDPEEEEEDVSPAVSEATQLPACEVELGGGEQEELGSGINSGGSGPSMGFPYFVQKKVSFRTQELIHWDRRNCRPSEEMDITRMLRATRPALLGGEERQNKDWTYYPGSTSRHPRSESPPLQAVASGGQHSESSAAYVLWPPARINGTAEERAAYFSGLQKDAEMDTQQRVPSGQQASTLLDLMTIRAFHSKVLRRYSLGTALGFRTRAGVLTNIPAIIVFVARKVHKQWLLDVQRLPTALEGPGGVWCDVDVVEFSYYGASTVTPKEQIYSELVEGLRGNDPCIGSGSQVASQETYGTLGAIVRSQTGARQVGFLTNRHVAVDLDYPNQKMFHPLPPNLGPGVYLGAVERATSFITDDLWYGIFAGMNPETFVRADGAFIPFAESFDTSKVSVRVHSLGELGEVFRVDLQAPIESIVGQHVVKVGRSSGLTKGIIMAYAVEYNDEKGICFFTDFLIVGENKQAFDLEGDSGSLISMTWERCENPRPVGIIWGGTANRGRLKLRSGHGPENWTSGVDLGRLLDLLQLDLITTETSLQDALEEQRRWGSSIAVGATGVPDASPKDYSKMDMMLAPHERLRSSGNLIEPGSSQGPVELGAAAPRHSPIAVSRHAAPLASKANKNIDLQIRLPVPPFEIGLALASTSPPEGGDGGGSSAATGGTGWGDPKKNLSEDVSLNLNLFDRDPKRRRSGPSP
ncbi:uncharacterized protein LOC9657764 isoform X1 [Selaginella moellendorffii]|uniref:uncharacterized protein LOC9657764 isoform X1 n=1 Tax=Selaginella moellendorffii TaxID=88036 RepID=UPI000D1C5FD3|nr:uncharacterized protein LOC9657764 isoform X1 [Selaginella moellendorffii]|eukprot:XP_024517729.1 uncharacterized protein LOC9657764 isoform X1 [Selaginella moellendorffii]